MKSQIKTIVVDLTPILPGGENGGAKIFVLQLVRDLAAHAPKVNFVLLTQASSHEDLANLDSANIRRLMVVGPLVTKSFKPFLRTFITRLLPYLPWKVRNAVNCFSYRLNSSLKRGSGALLRNLGADLLFCPFTAPTYFEPGIPTVCTIYDLQFKDYPEFFAAADLAHRDRTFQEACRKATALAAISDFSRDRAIDHGKLNPLDIRTIYLRMAHRIASEAVHANNVLNRLGLSRKRYLIFPANFWKHKNHEMLLTAFGIACKKGLAEDIKLVCTGAPGARRDFLVDTVRAMNLTNRVLFPGYIPDVELAALLVNSSGMVFPSLYEGFGLPVIEAMAAGVPVACSDMTSLPEVAADAAIFFDPRIPAQLADALIALAHDDALRIGLIEAGKKRAAEFSDSERMTKEYWEIILHAFTSKKSENIITGVYEDGWIGSYVSIQVSPAAVPQRVEVEFFAPEWLPNSVITIQPNRGGSAEGAAIQVCRGAKASCSLPVDTGGDRYDFSISPSFVPALAGYGGDQREICLMLQMCKVVGVNGSYSQLFPEESL